MAATQPFKIDIVPMNGSEPSSDGSHQVNPTWVITFVRYAVQDPIRTHNVNPLDLRRHLVIENDCIQVSTTYNKGTLTPSVQAVFVQTDLNYETAVHPGDFMIVNMLNWESDARDIAKRAREGLPINGYNDGFKGIFKVQGVRKTLELDPVTGTKTVKFRIDGFAFTEFNNTIYFNPNLINPKSELSVAQFIKDISTAWASFASRAGKPPLQDILAFLIQSLIGKGVNPKARKANGLVVSPNAHFVMPPEVGNLMNISGLKTAAQLYNYIFGIQQYSAASSAEPSIGLNPLFEDKQGQYPNFFYTTKKCSGNTILKAEYWNQVKLWSILNQYTNSPLNELFTCFRVDPKQNKVMPTVVFRQIPFTSDDFSKQKFGNQASVTKFMSLPRWNIDPDFVHTIDIGRDESARINFVQYFGRSNFSKDGMEMAGETVLGNFVFDEADIKRSGLRPYIVQNQFDDLPSNLVKLAPVWARILADAVIGGHLKLNGTIVCNGIVDPIAVGDNLEFDGVVYHIEHITHSCSINPSGNKTFRTTISLSHGVSITSDEKGTKYAEMTYQNAYAAREVDAQNYGILPGVSESQDTMGRDKNIDLQSDIDAVKDAQTGFVQPNLPNTTPKKGK